MKCLKTSQGKENNINYKSKAMIKIKNKMYNKTQMTIVKTKNKKSQKMCKNKLKMKMYKMKN